MLYNEIRHFFIFLFLDLMLMNLVRFHFSVIKCDFFLKKMRYWTTFYVFGLFLWEEVLLAEGLVMYCSQFRASLVARWKRKGGVSGSDLECRGFGIWWVEDFYWSIFHSSVFSCLLA